MYEQCWSWGYEHLTGAMITFDWGYDHSTEEAKIIPKPVPVQLVPFCGFCLSRILPYFPVSVCVCVTGVTSQFFTFITCPRPYKPYIFWKLLVQGYQNWYYQVSHTQIHKYKYTNTQIQHINSAVKTHHVAYFWKEDCSRISKMIFPCVKHANTKIQIQNTQTHKYSIWRSARKTQHVVYFWKEDCPRI